MYKIFKKKDHMTSADSKLVDTLTSRKQKNEMRYIKISTFFICLIFSIQSISSQSIDQIRNVDIDSYSDSQIASYWNKAQQQGYNLEQLELISKSKGMSSSEFMKLKNRILNLKTENKTNFSSNDEFSSEASELETFGLDGSESKKDIEKTELFGYDFFKNPSISFTPNLNLATPTNYQLGPGDELLIDIWGASENNYRKKVTKEGAIRIEGIGPIYVSGLSIEKATTKIISYLKKIYNGIGAANNSYNKVYAEVSLVGVRTVQVSMIGEVKVPGSYSLNALSTVLNALYAAGGPTKNGSFRNIKVIRGGKEFSQFDIYQYLLNGSQKGNIFLQDQDIIYIETYQSKIEVTGEVKRSGIYELKQNEDIQDLITYFSGFTSSAYKERLLIERVNGKEKVVSEVLLEQQKDFAMQDGDKLIVGKINDRYSNKVSIEGAVYRPGNYELTKDLTVSGLLGKASGIKENAFLERGLIYREINEVEQEVVSFSVKEILENKADITLQREDSVYIFDKATLKEAATVSINGAINTPQSIPFVENMTVEDFVAISGGYKDGADTSVIDVFRRLNDGNFETISQDIKYAGSSTLENKNERLYLQPFDIVSVRYIKGYTPQRKVRLQGEVSYPGDYAITTKEERISDLIDKAGGLSPYAYIQGATLYREKSSIEKKLQDELLQVLSENDSLVELQDQESFKIGINLAEILKEGGKGSFYDLILEEGDELFIPSQKQTIEIQGEVLLPSLVRYEKKNTLKTYIDKSGGFSENAKKGNVYVVYANGDIKTTKKFLFFKNYPPLKPGAVILVPNKAEKTRMSIQEILGITTTLGTLALLINSLKN
jgi:protein involved in polysaccharide export with SLBB domain